MTKDINTFKTELVEYINKYIAGGENTYIKKCESSNLILNRGHAIPVQVMIPAEFESKFGGFCPCFYAEELMTEFPKSTVPAIAEIINARINTYYSNMLMMMERYVKGLNMTMDDHDKKNLIVTALPTEHVPEENKGVFVEKELSELGLTLCMKAYVCENPENSDESYFVPVSKTDGRDATDEEWKAAYANTLRSADIHIACIPVTGTGAADINVPICGEIADIKAFYDYFYLLSSEVVWGGVARDLGADKIYILPDGAYQAKFVLDGPAIRENLMACTIRNIFAKNAISEMNESMGVFVFDYGTMTIRKIKEDDYNGI